MTSDGAYARAGVDLKAGERTTDLIKKAVRSTFGPEVLSDVGAFGGLFDASRLKELESPVLVSSTDGVGTKTKVAARMRRWNTIGQDLVNHCTNDILVQGARPLFFLDYVASSKLEPEVIATIVSGAAAACREAGTALLGGETAEMPGVYEPGEVDVVGTIVGVVDRGKLIDGSRIAPGDVVLGLPSSGLHTNGYSLARKALEGLDWEEPQSTLGASVGDALLEIHRSYLKPVEALWGAGVDIRGLSHITGGGLIHNPPRILPDGVGLHLRPGSWSVPPIFPLIEERAQVARAEMYEAFNMGLGMLAIVPAEQSELAAQTLAGDGALVGEVVKGQGEVVLE